MVQRMLPQIWKQIQNRSKLSAPVAEEFFFPGNQFAHAAGPGKRTAQALRRSPRLVLRKTLYPHNFARNWAPRMGMAITIATTTTRCRRSQRLGLTLP